MICPNCNTTNRDTAHYCLRCGWWLAPYCPFCQVDLPEGVFFCDRCGRQLGVIATPTDMPQYSSQAARLESPRISAATNGQSPTLVQNAESATILDRTSVKVEESGIQSILHRFVPAELLEKLQTARAKGEMVGERRVVTMLFCDVQGSTETAGQLDPEDWSEIMNDAFEYMIRPIYHYEGTIVRLMGDAILAFFGAPIAHEDDPQRAVLAGLEIQTGIQGYQAQVKQRWGRELALRVGVNTGLVVVGAVGSDLRMEYSALGDAINVAARMEQTAAPGTVQIAQDTFRLISPYFDFLDLGSIEVRGKTEPVMAYRVIGRRAEPGSGRGVAGLSSAVIGRSHELAVLHGLLADLAQGVGRILFITGEAGLGKSRLVEEAQHMFAEIVGSGGKWINVGGLSYEANHAYALLRSLLERIVRVNGITALSSEEMAVSVLNGTAESSDPQAQQAIEMLFGLQAATESVYLEGEAFKQALFRAIQAVWRCQIAESPTVVVCDDLHWADAASILLLEKLLPLVEEIPLVLIFAMRPEWASAGWQLKTFAAESYHHRSTELSLQALTQDESNELIDRLLAEADLPGQFRQRILERTAGNPFFLEEVLRKLIEDGILVHAEGSEAGNASTAWRVTSTEAGLDIPDNLQSLLAARIDRLDEKVRQTVQFASVVGRSFYQKILAALEGNTPEDLEVLNKQIKMLIRIELIQEAARFPDLEYRFRNPLTQEIAYQAILLKRRRELHRMVAEAYEQLFPERLVEFSTRLSHHYLEAQEFDPALKYLMVAGDAAFRLYAMTEAIAHYRQALKIYPNTQASVDQIKYLYLRLGRALELDSQFENALANYAVMEETARQRGDQSLELAALIAQGTIYSFGNVLLEPEKADRYASRGLELAHILNDSAAEAKIEWNLLNRYRFTGNVAASLEAGERSLAIARRLDLREQLAFTLNDIHWAYLAAGKLKEAQAASSEARGLWSELGNKAMLADNIASTAMFHAYAGEIDAAITEANEAFDIAKSINNVWGMSFSQMFLGTAHWVRGEFSTSIKALKNCLDYAEQSSFLVAQYASRFELCLVYAWLGQGERGLALVEPVLNDSFIVTNYSRQYLSLLCRAYLEMGKLTEAKALLETVYEELRKTSMFKFQYDWAWIFLLFAQGKYSQVVETARSTLLNLRDVGVRLFVPDSLLILGRAHMALGQIVEAQAAIQEAQAEAEAMQLNWFLWNIYAFRAEVEKAAGQVGLSENYLAQARKTVEYIVDQIEEDDLKESFLSRPDIQLLMDQGKG